MRVGRINGSAEEVDFQAIGDRLYEAARDFGGIRVHALRAGEFLALASDAMGDRDKTATTVTYLNPDYARRALRRPSLRRRINDFDAVLVDGNGVRWTAPLFGFEVPERLDTDGLVPQLLSQMEREGHSVFLLGCAPGVADLAAQRLDQAMPELRVAGVEHGYWDVLRGHPGRFDAADSAAIIKRINASQPDLVMVSLPTPLQQDWVVKHHAAIDARMIMTAGSYLDHVAENPDWPESWYPEWSNRWSLNWFYRLVREPRRLWKRYTVELLDFIWLAIRARCNASRHASQG